jgi:hypothetical protein
MQRLGVTEQVRGCETARANQTLISSIEVRPHGFVILYYVLDVQLFLQHLPVPHREDSLCEPLS